MVLALASSAAAANGQRLYASCAACHGTNGAGAGNALPVLAGQPKDALVASMRAFKTGARPATIMHQISKGYTDKQIEEIAVYLSRQKP
ncbi:c-type cytochrome [Massilia sp. R798]|uniref:C-type cytochrome n=2 Tax=Massilia soli TaxID=2792854 RepID=A0ABS7SUE8_9BURK|nr:c-type cytochrome [Massilia soli]